MKFTIASIGAAVLMASATFAAAEEKAGSPFEGFYAGAHISGLSGESDWSSSRRGKKTGHNISGVLGGAQFGGNYEVRPGVIVGLEIDGSYGAVEGSSSCKRSRATCKTKLNYTASLRPRVGIVQGDMMLYATGGVAVAGAELEKTGGRRRKERGYPGDYKPGDMGMVSLARILVDDRPKTKGGSFSGDEAIWGWTAGVGVEGVISGPVSARVEYRYTDYGEESFSDGDKTIDADISTHTVTIGLNIKL